MLYEADHYDADFMHAWLLSDMQKTLQEGYTRRQYDLMSLHLRNMVQGRVLSSPFPRDDDMVKEERERMGSYTLAQHERKSVLNGKNVPRRWECGERRVRKKKK